MLEKNEIDKFLDWSLRLPTEVTSGTRGWVWVEKGHALFVYNEQITHGVKLVSGKVILLTKREGDKYTYNFTANGRILFDNSAGSKEAETLVEMMLFVQAAEEGICNTSSLVNQPTASTASPNTVVEYIPGNGPWFIFALKANGELWGMSGDGFGYAWRQVPPLPC